MLCTRLPARRAGVTPSTAGAPAPWPHALNSRRAPSVALSAQRKSSGGNHGGSGGASGGRSRNTATAPPLPPPPPDLPAAEAVLALVARLSPGAADGLAMRDALRNWRYASYEGMNAHSATQLLEALASRARWFAEPEVLEEAEELLLKALSDDVLADLFEAPAPLAALLLAAAAALKTAAKEGGAAADIGGGRTGTVAPRAAALLPGAVDFFLQQQPNVGDVAAVTDALFVQLQWMEHADADAGEGRGGAQQLLQCMLTAAEPSLEAAVAGTDGVSVLACARLLEVCAACSHVPSAAWLSRLCVVARRALSVQPADADVLGSLVRSLMQLGGSGSQHGASLQSDEARVLLDAVTEGLLQEPALTAFRQQPESLVTAVQQLVALGVRPSESWVVDYANVIPGLLPQLSAEGLAFAAEGLARLHASLPLSSIEGLLLQAQQRMTLQAASSGSAARPDWRRYNTHQLGLLLGGVHALTHAAPTAGSSSSSMVAAPTRLGAEARDAWGRAVKAFTDAAAAEPPTYDPPQLELVAAAVATHPPAWPFLGSALLASRCASGPLPSMGLLLELLAALRNIPSGSSGSGGTQDGALRECVRESMADLAALAALPRGAGGVQLSLHNWHSLLRAARSAGMPPAAQELEAYCRGLAAAVVKAAASDEGSRREQAYGALAALERAFAEVLLPSLPGWAPPPPLGEALQGSMLPPSLLPHASVRLLALACAYGLQAGLLSGEACERVRQELQRRGLLTPPAPAPPAAQAAYAARDAHLADAFAVCYALDMGGCKGVVQESVPWLQELAATAALKAEEQEAGAWHGGRPALRALSLLHRSWLSIRASDSSAPHTSALPWAVGGAGGPLVFADAFASSAAIGVLRPEQLPQLVSVWASAAREHASPRPSEATSKLLLQRLAAGSCAAHVTPRVAANALLLCIPALRAGGGGGWVADAGTLASAAARSLSSLSLRNTVDLLVLLAGALPQWRLQQEQAPQVVERLVAAGFGRALTGSTSSRPQAEEQADDASAWPVGYSLQVVRTLVLLQPEKPNTITPVAEPLLTALFPAAKELLLRQAAAERVERTVRSAGAFAATLPVLWDIDGELGSPPVLESARAASEAMGSAVIALAVEDAATQQQQQGSAAHNDAGNAEPPSVPEAAALLSALVAASGVQPFPRPVAVCVRWLLGCEGVVRALEPRTLKQLLVGGLGGAHDLPLTDAAAREALAVLSPHRGGKADAGVEAVAAARLLRQRGASPAASSHEALLRLDKKAVSGLPLGDLLLILQEIDESGVRECLTRVSGQKAGPFGSIVLQCWRAMLQRDLLAPAALSTTADALNLLCKLLPKLSAAELSAQCKNALMDQRQDLADFSKGPWRSAARLAAANEHALWRLLDSLCTLGPVACTASAYFWAVTSQVASDDLIPNANIARDKFNAYGRSHFDADVECGAYLLDARVAAGIAAALGLALDAHVAAAAALEAGAGPPQQSTAATGGLLTCRQLGLLYGLVALRSQLACAGHEAELQQLKDKVLPLYMASLEALAARTDLPPLQHLSAVLDAVEPVFTPAIRRYALAMQSEQLEGMLLASLSAALIPLLMEDLPGLPVGLTHNDDAVAVVPALNFVTREALEADLYLPGDPNAPGLLLPEDLRPPPGRRHGFGDPAGDAAREAYVRDAAPWLVAAQRLVLLVTFFPGVGKAGGLARGPYAAPGVQDGPGAGRWAQLLWIVSGRA